MPRAVSAKILRKVGPLLAEADFSGMVRQVSLEFVPAAEAGDYILVHSGFAISRIKFDTAERTYDLLEAVGALEEELAGCDSEPEQE